MSIIPANSLARRRIAQNTEEGQLTLDAWDARIAEDNKVFVVDVSAHVKHMNPHYAAEARQCLLKELRAPECEVRALPPRELRVLTGVRDCQTTSRGRARGYYKTPVASLSDMVQLSWQFLGSHTFKQNCADLVCINLGGGTTLIDEVQQIRAAQEDLAVTQPTHPARVFGRAVEEQSLPDLVERAQQVRKQRNENDDMERRNVLACMQASQDFGMEVDDALQWSCRDRLADMMRGDGSGTDGHQVIHAGLCLAQNGVAGGGSEEAPLQVWEHRGKAQARTDGLGCGSSSAYSADER